MNHLPTLSLTLLTMLGLAVPMASADLPKTPAGIEHESFDGLLQKYVDDQGLVDYRAWNQNAEDVAALKNYLAQFAPAPVEAATGDEWVASLINAYNAFTIELILDHYPVDSIMSLDEPFDGRRHLIGGKEVSLNQIEHEMLRPLIGWKVHSVVVCAAQSCPPLLNRVYRAETWREQMQERYRAWLARGDLNRFATGRRGGQVEISKIFDWYSEDYYGAHSIEEILRRFGPPEHRDFLAGDFEIVFTEYDWSLNQP